MVILRSGLLFGPPCIWELQRTDLDRDAFCDAAKSAGLEVSGRLSAWSGLWTQQF